MVSASAKARRARLRRRRCSASGREVSTRLRTKSWVKSFFTSIPCWAIWPAVCSISWRISCWIRVSGNSTSSCSTKTVSRASWRLLRCRRSLSSLRRASRSARSSAREPLSLACWAKASSRAGSSWVLRSSRVISKRASRPAASSWGYDSGNWQVTVRLSPTARPRIPSTKPGIMRPSSNSTSMPSLLPLGMASLLSVKLPLKLMRATSPLAAGRSSTGSRVASCLRDCSSSSSTRAGSKTTGSASAWRPRVALRLGVGSTSRAMVITSSSPGVKRASRASKLSSSSGRPSAAIVSCCNASLTTLSISSSRAVARSRTGPICCSSTALGTLPWRKPGNLTLRLSLLTASS